MQTWWACNCAVLWCTAMLVTQCFAYDVTQHYKSFPDRQKRHNYIAALQHGWLNFKRKVGTSRNFYYILNYKCILVGVDVFMTMCLSRLLELSFKCEGICVSAHLSWKLKTYAALELLDSKICAYCIITYSQSKNIRANIGFAASIISSTLFFLCSCSKIL